MAKCLGCKAYNTALELKKHPDSAEAVMNATFALRRFREMARPRSGDRGDDFATQLYFRQFGVGLRVRFCGIQISGGHEY
jgi:hypothetical protein